MRSLRNLFSIIRASKVYPSGDVCLVHNPSSFLGLGVNLRCLFKEGFGNSVSIGGMFDHCPLAKRQWLLIAFTDNSITSSCGLGSVVWGTKRREKTSAPQKQKPPDVKTNPRTPEDVWKGSPSCGQFSLDTCRISPGGYVARGLNSKWAPIRVRALRARILPLLPSSCVTAVSSWNKVMSSGLQRLLMVHLRSGRLDSH